MGVEGIPDPAASHSSARLRFAQFEIDFSEHQLFEDGQRVTIQEKPFAILRLLLANPGKLVTREDLRRVLWPEDTFVDFENGINTAVGRLRQVLGDSAEKPRFVETVPRKGYRFIAEVDVSALQPETSSDSDPTEAPTSARKGRVWWMLPAAAALMALLVWIALSVFDSGENRETLLVVPFRNLSGNPELEYVSDGLTEEMIAQMGRLHPEKLAVIAPTSSMALKNDVRRAARIGDDFGADYILEGSVRPGGRRIHVTVQLIRTDSETQLWAESFSEAFVDVFEIQRQIAQRISRSLALELMPDQHAALARASTVNTAAYEALLKGRFHLARGREGSYRKAIESFEKAIRRDVEFGPAFVGLAEGFLHLIDLESIPPEEGLERASQATSQALAIDEDLPEARSLWAAIRRRQGASPQEVESAHQRAIQLNPSYADGHLRYALFLCDAQRWDQALSSIRRARNLDPASPLISTELGRLLFLSGRRPAGLRQLERTLEDYPYYMPAYYALAEAYRQSDRLPRAVSLLERAIRIEPESPKGLLALGLLYSESNVKDKAEEILKRLRDLARHRYIPSARLTTLSKAVSQSG